MAFPQRKTPEMIFEDAFVETVGTALRTTRVIVGSIVFIAILPLIWLYLWIFRKELN